MKYKNEKCMYIKRKKNRILMIPNGNSKEYQRVLQCDEFSFFLFHDDNMRGVSRILRDVISMRSCNMLFCLHARIASLLHTHDNVGMQTRGILTTSLIFTHTIHIRDYRQILAIFRLDIFSTFFSLRCFYNRSQKKKKILQKIKFKKT